MQRGYDEEEGGTLLYIASLNGEVGLVQKLLDLGASPNKRQLPVSDFKYNPNPTPLIASVEAHSFTSPARKHLYMKIIQSLISKGALLPLEDGDQETALHHALEWKNWELCEYLISLELPTSLVWDHHLGSNVFSKALKCQNDNMALQMINRLTPSDINSPESWKLPDIYAYAGCLGTIRGHSSPLKLAVECDRLDAVKLLLSKGANTDLPVSLLNKAIQNASIRMINFLLEGNIDVNVKDPTQRHHNFSSDYVPVRDSYLLFTTIGRVADSWEYDDSRQCKVNFIKTRRLHCILQILYNHGAYLTVENEESYTLLDVVTILKPSPEALVMLLRLDFKAILFPDSKRNLVDNIVNYIMHAEWWEKYDCFEKDDATFERVVSRYVRIVHLLSTLGCQIPDSRVLTDDTRSTHHLCKEEADVTDAINDAIAEALSEVRLPCSLKHLCRISIWENMYTRNRQSDISSVLGVLPPPMKSFVLFDEYIETGALLEPGEIIECQEQFMWNPPYGGKKLSETRLLLLCNDDFYSLPNMGDDHEMFELHGETCKKVQCYTAAEAQEKITAHLHAQDLIYNVVILHITETNWNVTSTEWCAQDIAHLASTTVNRWPNVKVIISQSLPRSSYSQNQNARIAELNSQIKSKISGIENVSFVEYNKLCNSTGIPQSFYYKNDGHSLNSDGICKVRNALGRMVLSLLELKPDNR